MAKIRFVKPMKSDQLVPNPMKHGYAPIPSMGCRVEYPGPDGYWARLKKAGVVSVSEKAPVVREKKETK